MIAQSQLTGLQVSRSEVRRHLRVRRWAQRTSHVFSTTTGPLSWDQRLWLAVLHAGPTALIGGLTAAKVHGLRNWDRDHITRSCSTTSLHSNPIEGVQFFRSRRPLADMRARGDLPLCMIEPAILLFAGYERNRRTAHGAVAAVVQQRLTDAERLRDWVERLKPLRRAKEFRTLLADISGGAQSLAEVDVNRACTEFGVRRPTRQRRRRDSHGRVRFTDCEWHLGEGQVLVLEVDGGFHMEFGQYTSDMRRQRRITTSERMVVRCSSYEIRHEPDEVMNRPDLARRPPKFSTGSCAGPRGEGGHFSTRLTRPGRRAGHPRRRGRGRCSPSR